MGNNGFPPVNLIDTTRTTLDAIKNSSINYLPGILPNTSNGTLDTDGYPDIPLGNYIGISTGVFAGVGILINALVISVVLLARRGRYSTYKQLMLHLAFADFFCSIVLVRYVPLELNSHDWFYPKAPCQIIYPIISTLTNISTGTILIITVERFRGVWFPHAQPWNSKDVRRAFMIVWSISLLIILPNIITLKVTKYKNMMYCNEVWENITHKRLYGFSFMFISFFIPFICIIVMHSLIIIRLKYTDLTPDNMSAYQHKQNKRIMRVLTGIIIVFFFTVSPNKILYFVWDISPELEKSVTSKARLYMRTFQVFYYSRVAISPLIYCFFDTRFKTDLKKSTRIVRGRSFVESEAPRSRSASQRTSTILSVRSRANSSFIGEADEAIVRCNNINRMSKINEIDTTVLNNLHAEIKEDNYEGRARTATVDTDASSQPGSASPLVGKNLDSK